MTKASDNSGEKKDRKENKCTKCGHFHGKNPCRKKKECKPCPYCLSIGVPEPKLSSHVEADCKYKNKTWEWKPPKTEEGTTQVAVTHQEEEPGTTQAAVLPQQDDAARSNAVRSLID